MRHTPGPLTCQMRTALVVDDESRCRTNVAQTLTDAGWQVLEARDGFQAIALLSRRWQEIGLLVVDTEMPGLHGWEVIRFARRKAPRVRVLRLGREADTAPAQEYRAFERIPTLEKPFTSAELLASLRFRRRAHAGR